MMMLISAGASLNETPELQQLALNFLATFFSYHLPEQQPSYCFCHLLLMQFSSAWALSSVILPLRQLIRPFTNNKALSGPPLCCNRVLFSHVLLRSGCSGVVCASSADEGD